MKVAGRFAHLSKAGFLLADGTPLKMTALAYDAATRGRRGQKWNASDAGPISALDIDLSLLIARSRAAYRNVPWVRAAINSNVSNEIGAGITPRFRCKNPAWRDRLQTLWTAWVDETDADGVLNFYGQLGLSTLERLVAGESFWRLRPRRIEDGLTVPLQLQLIEAEQLPLALYTTPVDTRCGIEMNGMGRRVAYWFHQDHPGDARYGVSGRYTRVPAENVIHHYQPLRAGQLRGEPAAAPILLRTRVFDDYDDAELVRKSTRAQVTGFIIPPVEPEHDDPGVALNNGAPADVVDGAGQITLEPGTMAELRPGEDIKFLNSDDTGNGYADFMRQQLLAIAAGFETPYELVTGDYSKINDRLYKAMISEFHRRLSQRQDHLVIHQICRRIAHAFIDAAVLSGALDVPGYTTDPVIKADLRNMEWRTDVHNYLHVLQDIQAKEAKVKAGFTSRQAVVAEMGGWGVEEIDAQNAEDLARARELGLSYSTDPVPVPEPAANAAAMPDTPDTAPDEADDLPEKRP